MHLKNEPLQIRTLTMLVAVRVGLLLQLPQRGAVAPRPAEPAIERRVWQYHRDPRDPLQLPTAKSSPISGLPVL